MKDKNPSGSLKDKGSMNRLKTRKTLRVFPKTIRGSNNEV